jgi:hypothetical protein
MLRLMKITAIHYGALAALLAVAGCSSGQVPGTTASAQGKTGTPSRSSSPTSVAAAGSSPSGAPTAHAVCDGTALSLDIARAEGAGTGQTAVLMTLRNLGPTACSLRGYPRLTALDGDSKVLPFRIHYGGSQSVTSQPPVAVVIGPGGTAFVTVGKYRCDFGDQALAQEIRVSLPDAASPVILHLGALSAHLPYCGPGDPGSELAVSPVEPTEAKTRSH